jgi:hypothetical protein
MNKNYDFAASIILALAAGLLGYIAGRVEKPNPLTCFMTYGEDK